MRLLPYDVFPQPGLVGLETIYRESDIITLHTPLTPETRNMIGAKEFKKMKPTAILINTARGGLVDERRWPTRSRTAPSGVRASTC